MAANALVEMLIGDYLYTRNQYELTSAILHKALPGIVRQIRKKRGMTQIELAEYLDVGHTFVSHMEAGRAKISHRIIERLDELNDGEVG